MTQEEIDAKIAELRAKYVDPAIHYGADRWPWVKAHWQLLVIAALLVCALFAGWRWQVHAAEAERLQSLVEIGATIEASEERLKALDARISAREAHIEAALKQAAEVDAMLKAKRDELKKANAAVVARLSKLDNAGVAKALTEKGYPARPVVLP